VGNPSDSAMRDFSAKCLTEFLKWSLKQTTKQVNYVTNNYHFTLNIFLQQQEKNPFNAKSLFKRLYNLSHHPDSYKRLGAALTFNEIHRVFREEEALVDQFALEMMHNNLSTM
jgi:DNA-dependent protein kinase catalytic subunit